MGTGITIGLATYTDLEVPKRAQIKVNSASQPGNGGRPADNNWVFQQGQNLSWLPLPEPGVGHAEARNEQVTFPKRRLGDGRKIIGN